MMKLGQRFVPKTMGLMPFTNMRWSGRAVAAWAWGSHGYAREFEIEKHWRDQDTIGLGMGGKALKTL